jgi:Na+/H+ antiporter 1
MADVNHIPAKLPRALIERLTRPFSRFVQIETAAGAVPLAATLVACLLSNSPRAAAFLALWEIPVGLHIGSGEAVRSLKEWINDGVMTLPRRARAEWLTLRTPGIPRTADGKPDLTAPTPRAPDGKPDLSGLWNTGSLSGSVLDMKGAQPRFAHLPRERAETFFKDNPAFGCLPLASHSAGGMRRFVQSARTSLPF